MEDEAYTIVRFNGSYSGHNNSAVKFHFDSWRVNAGPGLWLPAFIYSEENGTANYLAWPRRTPTRRRLACGDITPATTGKRRN